MSFACFGITSVRMLLESSLVQYEYPFSLQIFSWLCFDNGAQGRHMIAI